MRKVGRCRLVGAIRSLAHFCGAGLKRGFRFRPENVCALPIHEFFKRMPNGVPKASFIKAILQMFPYPLKKGLSKNLQFLPPDGVGLRAQPLELRRRQSLHDRGINLIGLLVP
jgi:hypothetical protein